MKNKFESLLVLVVLLLGLVPVTAATVTESSVPGAPEVAAQPVPVTCTAGQICVCLPIMVKGYNCTGDVSGVIVDATTANPLPDVLVTVDGTGLSAVTDAAGNYAIGGVSAGAQSVTAALSGYVTLTQTVSVACDTNNVLNFILSPHLAVGEMRIVLTWGATPRDMDSHLWLPEATPFHIYWFNPGDLAAFPFTHMDVDDTDGYGPETITIKQWSPGTYTYAVYRWADEAELTVSGAQVQVYQGTNLVATYDVPTEGTGRWWYVFDIDGASGAITTRDYLMVDSPGPYDPGPGPRTGEP